MTRNPRAMRLWRNIMRDRCRAKMLQRLTQKQARVFLKYMLEEYGLIKEPKIRTFRP